MQPEYSETLLPSTNSNAARLAITARITNFRNTLQRIKNKYINKKPEYVFKDEMSITESKAFFFHLFIIMLKDSTCVFSTYATIAWVTECQASLNHCKAEYKKVFIYDLIITASYVIFRSALSYIRMKKKALPLQTYRNELALLAKGIEGKIGATDPDSDLAALNHTFSLLNMHIKNIPQTSKLSIGAKWIAKINRMFLAATLGFAYYLLIETIFGSVFRGEDWSRETIFEQDRKSVV